jgi:hypothetical protein
VVDEKRRKHITSVSTVKAYKAAWPDEPLTAALAGFVKDPDCKKLPDRRNVLAHRIAPHLEFRIGPQVGLPPNAAQQDFAVAAFGEPVVTLIPTTLARAEELLTELADRSSGVHRPVLAGVPRLVRPSGAILGIRPTVGGL